MIRVVADPNVLISALVGSPGGASRRVVDAWQGGLIELVVSPRLLQELRDVLSGPKFARFGRRVEAYLALIESDALVVFDAPDPAAVSSHPDDDCLVALARAGRADLMVSGDHHGLDIDDLIPPVVTPRELLDRLPASGPG